MRLKAALLEFFGKAGQARQWLFQHRGDVVARAVPAHDQAFIHQRADRLACGHARDAETFGENAFRRQRIINTETAFANHPRQSVAHLQVEMGRRRRIELEFRDQ